MVSEESEALYQVVDVYHVIVDVASAQDDEGAIGNHPEHFEQPLIARPIDGGGACYGHRYTVIPGKSKRQNFGFTLRALVWIAGRVGCGLIGWGVGDMAEDADGAAVHEALDAVNGCGLEQVLGRPDVHLSVSTFAV